MTRSDPFPRGSTPLIRPGTGPLEAMLQRDEHDRQRADQLARIVRQADATSIDLADDKPAGGTLPGDTRRLRGIPAIGYGVSGAIPGTRPDAIR